MEKYTRYLLIIFLISTSLLVSNTQGTPINSSKDFTALHVQNDSTLVLTTVMSNSRRILRVSFNGNEGNSGTLKIFNASQKLVKEANFELIKSPFYSSVDIADLTPGTYSAELTTSKGTYITALTVK